MLDLVYSDRLDNLAEQLVGDLDPDRADPLAGQTIVVPNRRVASYLAFAIARARSIAANIEMPFLERYLTDRIHASVPGARVIDRALLRTMLVAALDDPAILAQPALAEIADYAAPGDGDAGAARVRRFQLAGKLAQLFVDYAFERPEMLADWSGGNAALTGTALAPTETWQRALWMAVFGDAGIARRLGGPERLWDTLPELVRRLPAGALGMPAALPIFGFAYFSRGQLAILRALATACDVTLYTFHPCRQFWEDIGDDETDAPALRLWGRPGRDAARLLGEATRCDFRDAFSEPDAVNDSALARLQRSILDRAAATAATRPDDSVRVLACPGLRRELEVIGNEIWTLVRTDRTLRWSDVAVLLAGRDSSLYQAHVSAVFRELGDIPCSVAELPLASESRIVEALGLLLDLPLGRFARPELLRLLTHPAVLGGSPGAGRDDWIHWTEALGVVHGADRRDHEGTYIRGDRYHWDQGLCRLALGACMAGEPSGIRETVALGGSASYLPLELAQDQRQSAAQFGLLARSLIRDARRLRGVALPLAEWAMAFDDLATAYLSPQSDDDVRSLERARDALAALAGLDFDGRRIDYVTAREHARTQLSELRTSRGELLADGVVVAPLGPMRSLPFRVVFVAGLGEGLFPAADDLGALDLRQAARTTGDVTPRDRDRWAFLETLLSARDRLYLSYVCRDARTGERLQPASVVAELSAQLGWDPTIEHARRRWDPRYSADLANHDPIGRRQARSLELRRDLARHLDDRELDLPTRDVLERALHTPALHPLARSIGILAPAPACAVASDPLALSTSQLRSFLECPMQAWAATILRMRDVDLEDPVARADEPFRMSRLRETALLRDVFIDALRSADVDRSALITRYRRRAAIEELAGRAPTGLFAELEWERHTAILDAWRIAAEGATTARRLSLGRAREHAPVDELLSPLTLAAGGRRIEIVGDLQPIADPAIGSLVLVAGETSRKHELRALIDHALLAAAEIDVGDRWATIASGAARPRRLRLAAWSPDEARSYLADLATELVDRTHDYFLPCEVVFKWLDRPTADIARIAIGMRDNPNSRHSSLYGPVRRARELEPPVDAAGIIERRFGPLLARRQPA